MRANGGARLTEVSNYLTVEAAAVQEQVAPLIAFWNPRSWEREGSELWEVPPGRHTLTAVFVIGFPWNIILSLGISQMDNFLFPA